VTYWKIMLVISNSFQLLKAIPLQALRVPGVWAPRFQDNWHLKVVRLSAVHTSHFCPQEIFPVLISVRGWVEPRTIVRPEGLSIKKSNDTIGNWTRNLPACSAVPQPTVPLHGFHLLVALILRQECCIQGGMAEYLIWSVLSTCI
jgi:hypothetical protein